MARCFVTNSAKVNGSSRFTRVLTEHSEGSTFYFSRCVPAPQSKSDVQDRLVVLRLQQPRLLGARSHVHSRVMGRAGRQADSIPERTRSEPGRLQRTLRP